MNQRQAFVATVSALVDEDPAVMLLLGDISVFAFREAAARHPSRVLNMGCCEQASVSFAAGLALEGRYPVYSTIDPFLIRRAYEFIRLDFGEQRLKGLFVTVGHDRDYAAMGPSHWCQEALVLATQIPGLDIFEPEDAEDAAAAIASSVAERRLAYVRLRA